MARKKVNLQFIAKDSLRRVTFKKRKQSLIQKVNELSTLCGLDACAIIYGLDEPQHGGWPNPTDSQRIITRFKNIPEFGKKRMPENLESFTTGRINKLMTYVTKQQKENRRYEAQESMSYVLSGRKLVNDFGIDHLNDMAGVIEEMLKVTCDQIQKQRNMVMPVAPALPMPVANVMEDQLGVPTTEGSHFCSSGNLGANQGP